MYVRFTKSKKSKHPTLQVVKGIREGKKVRQKIIASFGVIKSHQDKVKLAKLAENLMQKLEQEGLPNHKIDVRGLTHRKTVYDGFGLVVDRLMHVTGFSKVIHQALGKKQFDFEEIIKLIISQRLDAPCSKLRTYKRQEDHGFCGIDLQHIYRSMDAIEPLNFDIQKQAFKTICAFFSTSIDCFFFDVTTLYFESVKQDDIRDFGFSKDQKNHMVQIVLALVVDSQGIPIAYETFKGNLSETKTLIPVLESLRSNFSIKTVTVVCDRGLASKVNVEALRQAKFHFVIATKLRSISKKLKINDLSKYTPLPNQETVPQDQKTLFYTMPHPQYEQTMLIVTYSPSRAVKDREDRERILEKLKNKLSSTSDEATVKKVISNSGYKKYTNIKMGSLVMLNQKAIEDDATWDGFHGIAVSNDSQLSTTNALLRYQDLWHVEEAFRVAKCTLKTRPIFHWTSPRIKAHVLLCFMTLFFERFLELLLRKNNTPLTPDKIRYALSGVHSTYFEDKSSNKIGRMQSSLSVEAGDIFKALGLSLDRSVEVESCV
jgi:transposase